MKCKSDFPTTAMSTFVRRAVFACFLSSSLDTLVYLPADRGSEGGFRAGTRWKAGAGVSSRTGNPEILRLMLIQIVKMSRVRFLRICNGVNRGPKYATLHIDPLFNLLWNVSIKSGLPRLGCSIHAVSEFQIPS